mgnify:FL=1
MSRPRPPETCAQCGASIPPGALACRQCGADERTGWRESSIYDGLDLPESAYAGDTEEAGGSAGLRHGIKWHWYAVAALLLLLLVVGALGFR